MLLDQLKKNYNIRYDSIFLMIFVNDFIYFRETKEVTRLRNNMKSIKSLIIKLFYISKK